MEEKIKTTPDPQVQLDSDLFDQRANERREEESKGFTYVSTVGWICRREKRRRDTTPQND